MWPDVVAETDAWARRHCAVQTPLGLSRSLVENGNAIGG